MLGWYIMHDLGRKHPCGSTVPADTLNPLDSGTQRPMHRLSFTLIILSNELHIVNGKKQKIRTLTLNNQINIRILVDLVS
jgi:hypothetical protein